MYTKWTASTADLSQSAGIINIEASQSHFSQRRTEPEPELYAVDYQKALEFIRRLEPLANRFMARKALSKWIELLDHSEQSSIDQEDPVKNLMVRMNCTPLTKTSVLITWKFL